MVRKVIRTAPAPAKQRGIKRMGRPPAGASHAAWIAATMQLLGIVKMRGEGKTPAELAEMLAIGAIDEDGVLQHGAHYFNRYLSGKHGMTPDELQHKAELALRKGLLRDSDVPRGLKTEIEALIGQPRTLLSESLAEIRRERSSLVAARAAAIDAIRNLRTAMSECRTAAIAHTKIAGEEAICEIGAGVDLQAVEDALDSAYVATFAPRLLSDLVPATSGTEPAQIRHTPKVKRR